MCLPDVLEGQPVMKIVAPITTPLPVSPSQTHPRLSEVSGARFARLLNLGNGLSYGGGMGMPEWVMLDCGLLPGLFIGWCQQGHTLPKPVRDLLDQGLSDLEAQRPLSRRDAEMLLQVPQGLLNDEEWVPISEFCAIPTLSPSTVVGYSLFSLRRGLGTRAKALGLLLYSRLGRCYQRGVAQYGNVSALKAHLRFGPLKLIDPLTPMHTKAGETFIYELTLPEEDRLLELSGLRPSTHTARPLGSLVDPSQLRWISHDDLNAWSGLRVEVVAGRSTAHLMDVRIEEESLMIGISEERSERGAT